MPNDNGRDSINQDEIETPTERPTVVNPVNRPLVTILHNLALSFEAFPRAILKIARAIQDDPVAVHELHAKGIGGVIREASELLVAYANEFEGAKQP